MKKALLIFTLIFALIAVSCGESDDKDGFKESDYSPLSRLAALTEAEALADCIVYEPTENPIDDFMDYYLAMEALPEGVEEYVYFTSSKTEVCEAAVFKVKDEKTANALLDAFKARCDSMAEVFVNYSAEDTARAENMSSGAFDDIVWFAATKDNASIEKIIKG